MKKEIDLASKLAGAIVLLSQPGVGKLGTEMRLFVIIDQVAPHQLSVEDLCEITKLDRGTVAPAIGTLTKLGYVQEHGGLINR